MYNVPSVTASSLKTSVSDTRTGQVFPIRMGHHNQILLGYKGYIMTVALQQLFLNVVTALCIMSENTKTSGYDHMCSWKKVSIIQFAQMYSWRF